MSPGEASSRVIYVEAASRATKHGVEQADGQIVVVGEPNEGEAGPEPDLKSQFGHNIGFQAPISTPPKNQKSARARSSAQPTPRVWCGGAKTCAKGG